MITTPVPVFRRHILGGQVSCRQAALHCQARALLLIRRAATQPPGLAPSHQNHHWPSCDSLTRDIGRLSHWVQSGCRCRSFASDPWSAANHQAATRPNPTPASGTTVRLFKRITPRRAACQPSACLLQSSRGGRWGLSADPWSPSEPSIFVADRLLPGALFACEDGAAGEPPGGAQGQACASQETVLVHQWPHWSGFYSFHSSDSAHPS